MLITRDFLIKERLKTPTLMRTHTHTRTHTLTHTHTITHTLTHTHPHQHTRRETSTTPATTRTHTPTHAHTRTHTHLLGLNQQAGQPGAVCNDGRFGEPYRHARWLGREGVGSRARL